MATLLSNEITRGEPARYLRGTRVTLTSGTLTGTPVTGDVWQMLTVPPQTRVALMWWSNTDLGTAAPGTLGDGDDVDRYSTDVTGGTAGVKMMGVNTAGGFTYTAEDTIDIVWGTINTGAEGTVTVWALLEAV